MNIFWKISIIVFNIVSVGITASWWFTPIILLGGIFLWKIDELG